MAAAEREAGTTEWEEMRAVFEHAEHAIAVYRFADGRVKTVCISDGLYAMMHTAEERDKEALIRRYDTDMYRNVVPEDAARIAAEAKRFATEGGRYDVVYREKVYQRNYYTLTHAVGYHHYLSDGSRIAVIVYTDIEDAEKANEYARMYEGNTLRNFLDRGELLYCNAPMRRLLRPAVHVLDHFAFTVELAEHHRIRRRAVQVDALAAPQVDLVDKCQIFGNLKTIDVDVGRVGFDADGAHLFGHHGDHIAGYFIRRKFITQANTLPFRVGSLRPQISQAGIPSRCRPKPA